MSEHSFNPEVPMEEPGLDLPRIDREIHGPEIKKLSTDHYQFFQYGTESSLIRDPANPAFAKGVKNERIPIQKLETVMMQDTDELIGILDGSIRPEEQSKYFLNGQPRYEGPIKAAVYLDKSARPVSWLVREVWSNLSDGKLPDTYFANIDKKDWLKSMGFEQDNQNLDNIPPEHITLDLIDPDLRRDLVTRLRALYTEISDLEDDQLDAVWERSSHLSGKHVAIIDEVRSSSATLVIADQLYREAFPDAMIEPLYWSVPNRLEWKVSAGENGQIDSEFAASRVPPWYDSDSLDGRGIGDKDEDWSAQSSHRAQRVGAPFLSTPVLDDDGQRAPIDNRSLQVRADIKLMANRFKQGLVSYVPGRDNSDEQLLSKIEQYYGPVFHAEGPVVLQQWRPLRGGNGQALDQKMREYEASRAG